MKTIYQKDMYLTDIVFTKKYIANLVLKDTDIEL